MVSSGLLRRVALVRTDVSEELSAYFIRVKKIVELSLAVAICKCSYVEEWRILGDYTVWLL
jgi:hypothetical protein